VARQGALLGRSRTADRADLGWVRLWRSEGGAERLKDERARRALTSFLTKSRKRRTARTSCAPAFVVEGCRQHVAPPGALGPTGSADRRPILGDQVFGQRAA
jgi:hypothetical protein